jgi:hypothetical protein
MTYIYIHETVKGNYMTQEVPVNGVNYQCFVQTTIPDTSDTGANVSIKKSAWMDYSVYNLCYF